MNLKTAARIITTLSILAVAATALPRSAHAFCGFYVGKADAGLYNHASQVAIVRNGDRTVISLMNDYAGPLDEFALVVPVPTVLEKGQVHVGDRALFSKLDAYSSPRLVEYHDSDPCELIAPTTMQRMAGLGATATATASRAGAKALGVTIESEYTVGEYDIVILSAKQSGGLETWLVEQGYKIPAGASALEPYIRQGMKFFVAKVNLTEQKRTGLSYLRPLQFAFESPKFMLPIRLGMINAQGPQDLIIYMLTEQGRVETINYRTVKLPTAIDIPDHVRDNFGDFYKAMFNHQVALNDNRAVFTEYVWNMSWCDPCAGPPLSPEDLRALGVFWLGDGAGVYNGPSPRRGPYVPMYRRFTPGAVILTRLHVRYSADTFPEDLMFQETQDQESYQARYVIRDRWTGSPDACPRAREYFERVHAEQSQEAQNLAELTGWDLNAIMKQTGYSESPAQPPWWQGLWQ
ncbi:MAG: DUF2330 domain-containing protein [Candidatus Binataceae bacterium]